jgi:hypothetical protein
MTPYGTLAYRIGETYLTLPVVRIELRQRRVIITARIEVKPGDPDITLPGGDWPCTLIGEDGNAVYSAVPHIEGDTTVHCPAWSKVPAHLIVVQPFGDPAMQDGNR